MCVAINLADPVCYNNCFVITSCSIGDCCCSINHSCNSVIMIENWHDISVVLLSLPLEYYELLMRCVMKHTYM